MNCNARIRALAIVRDNLNECADFDLAASWYGSLGTRGPMVMGVISPKALLISNVAYVLLAIIFMILVIAAAAVVAFVGYGSAGIKVFDAFRSSQAVLVSVIFFAIFIASLGAGYIAGRVAKRRYLLNGALATSGSILFNLYGLIIGGSLFDDSSNFAPWVETLFDAVVLVGGPLLALLGGYFAELRQRQLDAMSAEQGGGAGYWSRIVTVMRWAAAFAVAAVVYIGFLKLIPFVVGHSLLTIAFAVTFAIIFATSIVPASHRKVACLLFIAIATLWPAAVFVRHALLGTANHVDGMIVFLNIAGASLAYWHLRRMFSQSSSNGRPTPPPLPAASSN
jgi:hypothetical protein